jgi:uncharacterized protein
MVTPASGNLSILGELTMAEVAAGLAGRRRASGGLSEIEYQVALTDFLSHCRAEYQLVPIARPIIDGAVALTQNYRLRGYDAVQLATALAANRTLVDAGLAGLVFVTADNDLLAAARSEGLAADNPNARD